MRFCLDLIEPPRIRYAGPIAGIRMDDMHCSLLLRGSFPTSGSPGYG
jgi:hypothetical protein